VQSARTTSSAFFSPHCTLAVPEISSDFGACRFVQREEGKKIADRRAIR
jgi:hypothetical protein